MNRHSGFCLVIMAVLAVVTAGCGRSAPSPSASRLGAASSPTLGGTAPSTTAPGAVGLGHPSGHGSTTAGSPTLGGTASVGSPTTVSSAPPPPGPIATLTPPPGGTYAFRQTGSTTSGGTTKPVPSSGYDRIAAASTAGVGAWKQIWHTYVDPSQPPTDTSWRIDQAGISVVELVTRVDTGAQTITVTCTFNPPVRVTPWPPQVGYSFSGRADCGSFQALVKGQIDGTRRVVLDGAALAVFVIDYTVTASGQVSLSEANTDWFSPGLRLIVHEASQESGTYGIFSFSSRYTRDLVSGHPE